MTIKDTFWCLSIAAQILACLVGYLGRFGFRRVPRFIVWIAIDAVTSIGMFWLNRSGRHTAYFHAQHIKWALVIVPGATLATIEAVQNLRMRSLRWVWSAVPAAFLMLLFASRPHVWPQSAQEGIFAALATIDTGLAYTLAIAVTSRDSSLFARQHGILLALYLGMNALGYFGASLYFPLIGRGLMLGSFLAWMAWVWIFARTDDSVSK